MSTQTLIPLTTIPAGTHPFGPLSIATGLVSIRIELDRTAWTDAALRVSCSLDFSLDGGVTWASTSPSAATNPFPVAIETTGGVITDKNGTVLTKTTVSSPLPSPSSLTRQIRGVMTNNLSCTTSGVVITS